MPKEEETIDWREAAVRRALHAGERGGETEYALLAAIRERIGECGSEYGASNTLRVHIRSSERYRAFVEQFGVGRLVETEHLSYGRGKKSLQPSVGWHAFDYEGFVVEAAVVPDTYDLEVILLGAPETTLESFSKEMTGFCEKPASRYLIYSNNSWSEERAGDSELERVDWSQIVLAEKQTSEIRAATESFFARRDIYHDMGVAWRRGVMLAGPPGTGKTMICRAVAAALPDYPFLYVRDLSGYDTQEEIISEVFEKARSLAPAILVFEDIDGLVDDSNRTVFLNELDGFNSNEGLLVLASSNHPERVDEALLKRPSRFDRIFHVTLPAEEERRKFCTRMLRHSGLTERVGGLEGADTLAYKVARLTHGFTLAYLQEAFVSASLALAHEDGYETESYSESVISHVERLRTHISEAREPSRMAEMRDPESGVGFGSQ